MNAEEVIAGSGLNAAKLIKTEQEVKAEPEVDSAQVTKSPMKPVAPSGGPPRSRRPQAAAIKATPQDVPSEGEVSSALPDKDARDKAKNMLEQGFKSGKLQETLGEKQDKAADSLIPGLNSGTESNAVPNPNAKLAELLVQVLESGKLQQAVTVAMGKQDVSNRKEKTVTPTMAKLDHASANQNQTAKLADLLVQGLNSGKLEDAVGKFMKNAPANVNVEVQAEMPDMKAQGTQLPNGDLSTVLAKSSVSEEAAATAA